MPVLFHCVGGLCSGACLDATRAIALETDCLSTLSQSECYLLLEAKYPDHGSTI
jgi:hypothetical protein